MNGTVAKICENYVGDLTYGFIRGDDGKEYFFHKNYLVGISISSLKKDDVVEFTPTPSQRRPGETEATRVRKYVAQGSKILHFATKGIHPDVDLDSFNPDEMAIIKVLSKALFITYVGKTLTVGNSQYRYALVKPTEDYVINFNLQREIPVIFSNYEIFEPRCLDAAAIVAKDIPSSLRLDRSCQILISRDNHVEETLANLLRDSNLSSVVIPFSYEELMSKDVTPDRILDRFRKYLFDADLFTTSQPIDNDVFFFGRRDYALDVATKCKNSSYLCGVFGLRRSGKTSMLFAIKRQLENAGCPVAFIPCQTELETLGWKQALYQVTEAVRKVLYIDPDEVCLHSTAAYEAENANNIFTDDMSTMLQGRTTPVVLMFDEIEAITFGVGKETSPWHDGDSFIHFWNVLRGFCTTSGSNLSIVVAGTNPMINEIAILDRMI